MLKERNLANTISRYLWRKSKPPAIMRAFFGSLAQLVEQRTFNPLVAGSSPARPTKIQRKRQLSRAGVFVFTARCRTNSTKNHLLDYGNPFGYPCAYTGGVNTESDLSAVAGRDSEPDTDHFARSHHAHLADILRRHVCRRLLPQQPRDQRRHPRPPRETRPIKLRLKEQENT